MQTNNFFFSNYKISYKDDLFDAKYGITPEINEKLKEIYIKVKNNKINVLHELQELIKMYPHIPQFKNYLSIYYQLNHRKEKAHKINIHTNNIHPEYLFGKIALANDYIDMKMFKKVPELLGDIMELKQLYPDRNEFHFSEVESFFATTIRYYIGIKNLEAAESRLDLLKNLNPDYANLEYLQNAITTLKLELAMERWERESEFERTVKSKSKKVIPESTIRPQFNNAIIEKLYENDFSIDIKIIKEILSLQNESLIDDLHNVCYDSIARYKYFSKETDWDESTHNFMIHALLLLTEINSERSLKVVLDILSQNEKFLDYWFSDFLSEVCWRFIYKLGFDHLKVLSDFLKEPDRFCYARSEISVAVSQIAMHYPSRRDEVLDWYKELFNYLIKHKDDNRLIDTSLIGLMISDVLDLNGRELLPEIRELFEHMLVSPGVCGDFSDILKELEKPQVHNFKRKVLSIFENYEELSTLGVTLIDDKIEEPYPNYEPASSVKIGRNEPCLCGSGKKFKKCCGK